MKRRNDTGRGDVLQSRPCSKTPSRVLQIPHRRLGFGTLLLSGCALAAASGCQSMTNGPWGALGSPEPVVTTAAEQIGYEPSPSADAPASTGDVAQASATQDPAPQSPESQQSTETAPTVVQKAQQATDRLVSFVTRREQVDPEQAKKLYRQGDAAFRQAKDLPEGERAKQFTEAAVLFRRAGESSPGTALHQDALFMQGESLFFADNLTDAAEIYGKLQKDFPRNRHSDRIAARLFSISRYWIATAKATEGEWFTVNLTDKKRPAWDADGHAIRVLDQIRYDDPTGRLADDATMAAAAEFIRQKKFGRADEFLTDLRKTFTDSDHLFLAHLLGIRCKLEVYAGPEYSNAMLEEADKLVTQTRQRFPGKLQEPKYREMVARAAAEIAYHRAEHLNVRAEYRYKRREYGAAQQYYQMILQDHGDTPFAEIARERLAEVSDLPPVPQQRLSWLTKIFPDSERAEPLEMTVPSDTMLR